MAKKKRKKGKKRSGGPPKNRKPQSQTGASPEEKAPVDVSQSLADGGRRKAALERRQKEQRRRQLRIGGIGLVILAILAGLFFFNRVRSNQAVAAYEELSASSCGEVQNVGGLSRDHVEEGVDYDTSPPVGGAHSASSLPAGVYPAPLGDNPNEDLNIYRVVHSMEHGYVVVWHNGLSEGVQSELENAMRGERKVIVAPYPDLEEGKVALTTWGVVQRCDEADMDVIREFVDVYRERTAPEPNAA